MADTPQPTLMLDHRFFDCRTPTPSLGAAIQERRVDDAAARKTSAGSTSTLNAYLSPDHSPVQTRQAPAQSGWPVTSSARISFPHANSFDHSSLSPDANTFCDPADAKMMDYSVEGLPSPATTSSSTRTELASAATEIVLQAQFRDFIAKFQADRDQKAPQTLEDIAQAGARSGVFQLEEAVMSAFPDPETQIQVGLNMILGELRARGGEAMVGEFWTTAAAFSTALEHPQQWRCDGTAGASDETAEGWEDLLQGIANEDFDLD